VILIEIIPFWNLALDCVNNHRTYYTVQNTKNRTILANYKLEFMTFSENQFPKFDNLPPRLPSDAEDISRAVCLLGNRIASDLKDKAKKELIFLLGAYPNPEQAKLWKHTLKKRLKTEFGNNEPEGDDLEPKPIQPPPAVRPSASKTAKSANQRANQKSKRQTTKSRSRQSVRDRLFEIDYPYTGVSNLASIDISMFRDDDNGFDD
jgi:hypothetical protein